MKRRFSTVLKQLKRNTVVKLAGASNPQRQAVVSLLLVVLTEVALLALTFCTNFLSAFIHNTLEVFHDFRLRSLDNAQRIVSFERTLGIFFEEPLQQWHEKHVGGWSFWNTYYAGVHPVVTVVFLVFILMRMFAWKLKRVNWKQVSEGHRQSGDEDSYYAPDNSSAVVTRGSFNEMTAAQQYRFLRSVWVLGAWVAFFGFLFAPTMPPRLLPVCDFFNAQGANVGACLNTEFSFMDSIGLHGSLLWDWNDESVKTLNNPYAAFPSQHTIFAAWCALSWIHLVGPNVSGKGVASAWFWVRGAMRWGIVLYPMVTIYCIIITANHYIADALFGLLALAFSYAVVYFYYSYRSRHVVHGKEMPGTLLPY
ncbi:hypothetical protein EC988_004442 [Linderina pennispora]|nr:hypothetical protein EC988_004442 [Linderina pennispora]